MQKQCVGLSLKLEATERDRECKLIMSHKNSGRALDAS